MRNLQRLLVGSLLLNLLFCGLALLFVYQRGGIPYLLSKIAPASQPTPPPVDYTRTPLYAGRTDTYATLPRQNNAIIFAGDSITDLGEWDELLQQPVLNRGISSDTVEGLHRRIDEVLHHQPAQLFIMIGINDLFAGKSGDEVWATYVALIDTIRQKSPQTRLLLQSILPVNSTLWGAKLPPHLTSGIVQVNQALHKLADDRQIFYVDLYTVMVVEVDQLNPTYTSDGVHLNGAGYRKWGEVIRPYLASGGL